MVIRVEALEDRFLLSGDPVGNPNSVTPPILTAEVGGGTGPSTAVATAGQVIAPMTDQVPPQVDAAIGGLLGPTGAATIYKVPLNPAWPSLSLRFTWSDPDAQGGGTLAIVDDSGQTLGQVSLSDRPVVLPVRLRPVEADAGASLYLAVLPPPSPGSAAMVPSGQNPGAKHKPAAATSYGGNQSQPDRVGASTPLSAAPVSPGGGASITVDPGRGSPGRSGVELVFTPYAITLPTPMPPGVPAGGIFQQIAPGSGGGNGMEIPLDSVAADLPSLGTASVAPTALAAARGVPFNLDAGPAAAKMLGPGGPRPSPALKAAIGSAPVKAAIEMASGPGRERAELPDISAFGNVATLPCLSSDAGGSSHAERHSAGTMSHLPVRTRDTEMAASVPDRPERPLVMADEHATAATREDKHWVGVSLAIYGAASMTIRGSEPGLASMLRRGRGREGPREHREPDGSHAPEGW